MTKQRITCVRRLTFEAGHRIKGHENKCGHLHGHSYKIFLYAESVELQGVGLDMLGRIIDFGVLKEKFGTWIDEKWDHGFLLSANDTEGQRAMTYVSPQKVYLMEYVPTAENIARHLLVDIAPALLKGTGVRLFKVVTHETENCFAEAILDDDSN